MGIYKYTNKRILVNNSEYNDVYRWMIKRDFQWLKKEYPAGVGSRKWTTKTRFIAKTKPPVQNFFKPIFLKMDILTWINTCFR